VTLRRFTRAFVFERLSLEPIASAQDGKIFSLDLVACPPAAMLSQDGLRLSLTKGALTCLTLYPIKNRGREQP